MPQRTCIGCRRVDDQDTLIRLVRVGGVVVLDTYPRSQGRGAYLHRHCRRLVMQRHALARAFRGTPPDPELVGWLEQATS